MSAEQMQHVREEIACVASHSFRAVWFVPAAVRQKQPADLERGKTVFTTKSLLVPATSILISLLGVSTANAQDTSAAGAGATISRGATQRSLSARLAAEQRPHAPATNQPMVDDYKITILSDFIPGRRTIGEWGFAALIEITSAGVSKRFMFDTGGNPQTVISNAKTLNIPLCDIQDVILSHNHDDHTSGLDTLRSTCKATNPDAFKNAYIGGEEMFWPRIGAGALPNIMVDERSLYQAQGGNFILNTQPTQQFLGLPGVWLTGKIARKHDEKTYPGLPTLQDPTGTLNTDIVPEETSLVINTATGMVIVTGCAHSGIINTIETAQAILGAQPPVTIVGGVHFYPLPLGEENTAGVEGSVIWEATQMVRNGVVEILGAHCTGLERFAFVRDFLGLDDSTAVYSTIGTVLSMSRGFGYTFPAAMNLPLHPGWETQLQTLTCGTKPPTASCQASVSVWNYYLVNGVSPKAIGMVIGNGTQMMTVQQYLAARAAAGM